MEKELSESGTSQRLSKTINFHKLMVRTIAWVFGRIMSQNHIGNCNITLSQIFFLQLNQTESFKSGIVKKWLKRQQTTMLLTQKSAKPISAIKALQWKNSFSKQGAKLLHQLAAAGYQPTATNLWWVTKHPISHFTITILLRLKTLLSSSQVMKKKGKLFVWTHMSFNPKSWPGIWTEH